MLRSIVNKMQKAAHFLKYPILQYIPIGIYTMLQNDNWSNPFSQTSPQLLLFQDEVAFKSALQRFQVQITSPPRAGELYIICLNFKAGLVLFRYLTCKIIGIPQVGSIHVFSLTKKYFPHHSIHFALYAEDGRKLRSVNQDIS
ncbi:MAG: hypothetical protein GX922_08430 [Firmicutes bacterium]|mgnify:CR=1 FL=1|nr:hypothetical protein [Bacillota bacterium]